MSKTINLSFPHKQSPDELKQRVIAALADARRQHPAAAKDLHETWTGNRVDFTAKAMGQTISGNVRIEPQTIFLEVTLPFMLAMLANKFRPQMEAEAKKLIEQKSK